MHLFWHQLKNIIDMFEKLVLFENLYSKWCPSMYRAKVLQWIIFVFIFPINRQSRRFMCVYSWPSGTTNMVVTPLKRVRYSYEFEIDNIAFANIIQLLLSNNDALRITKMFNLTIAHLVWSKQMFTDYRFISSFSIDINIIQWALTRVYFRCCWNFLQKLLPNLGWVPKAHIDSRLTAHTLPKISRTFTLWIITFCLFVVSQLSIHEIFSRWISNWK